MNAEPTPLQQKIAQCEAVIASRAEGDPVRVRRERAVKELQEAIAAETAATQIATADTQK